MKIKYKCPLCKTTSFAEERDKKGKLLNITINFWQSPDEAHPFDEENRFCAVCFRDKGIGVSLDKIHTD